MHGYTPGRRLGHEVPQDQPPKHSIHVQENLLMQKLKLLVSAGGVGREAGKHPASGAPDHPGSDLQWVLESTGRAWRAVRAAS